MKQLAQDAILRHDLERLAQDAILRNWMHEEVRGFIPRNWILIILWLDVRGLPGARDKTCKELSKVTVPKACLSC